MSTARARALRRKPTWAEKRLWRLLRSRRLAGYKFRRQKIHGQFYLDLYCHEARLAVELDGGGHGWPEQRTQDRERDDVLSARGIVVKRFWNHQLATNESRQNLVHNLWLLLQERAPHPENVAPPPYRRAPDQPKAEKPSP